MELKEKESQKGQVCARNIRVWRPALKGPNGVRGKAPENIWLFDTYKALEPI